MDAIYARVSKAGTILCGRQDEDGHYTCDGQLACYFLQHRPAGPPARYLVPLPGWSLDGSKGIWQKTTRVEDLRARGRSPRQAAHGDDQAFPRLPALARCPKCRAVQWLDPSRLKVTPGPNF